MSFMGALDVSCKTCQACESMAAGRDVHKTDIRDTNYIYTIYQVRTHDDIHICLVDMYYNPLGSLACAFDAGSGGPGCCTVSGSCFGWLRG